MNQTLLFVSLVLQCLTGLAIAGAALTAWQGINKNKAASGKAEKTADPNPGNPWLVASTLFVIAALVLGCLGFATTAVPAFSQNTPAATQPAPDQPAPDQSGPDQQPPVVEQYAKLSNGCESIVPLPKDLPATAFYSANPGETGPFLASRFNDDLFPTSSVGYKDYNAGIYIQVVYTGCESAQIYVEYGVTYSDRKVRPIDAIGTHLVENYVFVYPSSKTALYPLTPQMGQDAYVLTVLIKERAQKVLSTSNVGIHWRGQNDLPPFGEVERFP